MGDFTEKLIRRAAGGDQQAITELYELTYSSVYKTVKSMVADEDSVLDIVQDSYIKGFQSLEQLDAPENFRAWMKRIAVNKAKDYLKRKKPILFSEMAGEEGEEIDFRDECLEHCPEEMLDRKETTRLMQEILAGLGEDQRMVIGMFYYEEMSIRQIAETLGCSENTVKSRLNYGRKKIEIKVRDLEKKGVKLYSLAPVAFFLWLLRMYKQVPEVPSVPVLEAVTTECGGAASGAVGAAAGTAGAFAGAGAKTLVAKIVAGLLAATVVCGGVVTAFLAKTPEEEASPGQTTIVNTEPTVTTAPQETTTPMITEATQPTVAVVSFDKILEDIRKAVAISPEDYDANAAYYDELYSHLGEGAMWELTHRKYDIYITCIFAARLDLDGDGEKELCVCRAVSPSRPMLLRIYKQDGTILYGDAIFSYAEQVEGNPDIDWEFCAY